MLLYGQKKCTFDECVNSFSVPNFKPYLEKHMVPDKQDLTRRKKNMKRKRSQSQKL